MTGEEHFPRIVCTAVVRMTDAHVTQEAMARRGQLETAKAHSQMKASVVFTINGKPIEMVEEFTYLGRVVTQDDNDEVTVK